MVGISIGQVNAAQRPGAIDACQRCSVGKVPCVHPALVSGAVDPTQTADGLQLKAPFSKCFMAEVEIETFETADADLEPKMFFCNPAASMLECNTSKTK